MASNDEFPKLLALAAAEIAPLTAALVREYALETLDGWSFDEAGGRLLFSAAGRQAMFAAQVVGLYYPSGSWRWAWNEPAFASALVAAATEARQFGEANAIPLLTDATSTISEQDAGHLAAFAARLIGWPGVYRGVGGPVTLYLIFAPLQIASPSVRVVPAR